MIRTRDLASVGIGRVYLARLQERGLLQNVGRGVYRATEPATGEHQTLVEVARRVPDGVICLLSWLRFHAIGTQNPHAVWLATEKGNSFGKRNRIQNLPDLEVVASQIEAFVMPILQSSEWQPGEGRIDGLEGSAVSGDGFVFARFSLVFVRDKSGKSRHALGAIKQSWLRRQLWRIGANSL